MAQLAADLSTHVAGRKLDDNAQMLLRFANGARGALWASQVAPGNENGLRLRIYGAKGGLEWSQEEPNHLRHAPYGQQPRMIARGGPGADAARRKRRAHSRRTSGGLPGSVRAAVPRHRGPDRGV